MQYLGDITSGTTIRGSFNTRTAAGVPITLGGTPVLSVYKDAGTTETTTGVTLTVDFDSRTGHHVFSIVTSDAFYSTGADYRVVITTGTVDGTSVVGTEVGSFSIQNRTSLVASAIRAAIGLASANLDTQLSGIPTAVWGAGTRTLTGFGTLVTDVTTAVWSAGTRTLTAISDSSGITTLLTRIVGTLAAGTHNAQSGDSFARLGAPVGASISADVQTRLATSGYTAPPNAATNATAVRTELATELARIDAAISTRLASASYTAPPSSSTIASDVWAAATRTITGGTVTTVSDKTGYSLSQAFPANFASLGINASGHVSRVTLVDTTTTNTDMRGTDNALLASSYTTPPSVSAIADQVWDEVLSGHLTAGSTGNALNAAGSSGDPWATVLPGAYGAGSAGKIIGDNLNATISSRASQASLDTLDDYVDTEVAAIKAKTDQLTFTVANQVDSNALSGGGGGLDAAGVRAAIGLASANLDAQLADLPTVSEFNARSLPSADYFVVSDYTAPPSTETIVSGVWGALVADHTVNNSFGAKLLIASNPQREVQVTGSSHIAADVHAFQADAITSSAIAASAVSELQSGLALETTSQSIKSKTDNLPSDPADQSILAAAIAAIPTTADPDNRLLDVWRRLGLDPANPLVNTADQISAGSVLVITVTQTSTSVTTTRQP